MTLNTELQEIDAFGKEFHLWMLDESVQSVLNAVSDGVFNQKKMFYGKIIFLLKRVL